MTSKHELTGILIRTIDFFKCVFMCWKLNCSSWPTHKLTDGAIRHMMWHFCKWRINSFCLMTCHGFAYVFCWYISWASATYTNTIGRKFVIMNFTSFWLWVIYPQNDNDNGPFADQKIYFKFKLLVKLFFYPPSTPFVRFWINYETFTFANARIRGDDFFFGRCSW